MWEEGNIGTQSGIPEAELPWGQLHSCGTVSTTVSSPWPQPGTVTAVRATGCPWRGIFGADLSPLHPVHNQGWILQEQAHTSGKTELFFLSLSLSSPPRLPSVCVQGQQSFGMPGQLQDSPAWKEPPWQPDFALLSKATPWLSLC